MYSVFLMQRRKDLWGPDGTPPFSTNQIVVELWDYIAEEFDPDRFLDDRLKKYLISNSFAFLPFNAGPRICLGQQVLSCPNSPNSYLTFVRSVRLQRDFLHGHQTASKLRVLHAGRRCTAARDTASRILEGRAKREEGRRKILS